MSNSTALPRAKIKRMDGQESFHGGGKEPGVKLQDFWQWSVSDLLSNATRGILAEYLVAEALGLANDFRREWAPYDLKKNEVKIEVKSFSPFQSWPQKKLSKLSFNIRPTLYYYDEETYKYAKEKKLQADVYVFCVLGAEEAAKLPPDEPDKDKVDPLNLGQWDFYVVKASVLKERFPTQKTIGAASFQKLNLIKVKYAELGEAIHVLSLS